MKKLILISMACILLGSCGYNESVGEFYYREKDTVRNGGDYVTEDHYQDGLVFNKVETNNFEASTVVDLLCADIVANAKHWQMDQYHFINKNGVQIWIKDGIDQYYVKASKDYIKIDFTEEERLKLDNAIQLWKQITKYKDKHSKSLIDKFQGE